MQHHATAIKSAFAFALAATVFFSPAASARPEMAGQTPSTRFEAMDTDKDGKVSREEFFAAQPNMKEGAFAAIDKDTDGFITLEEWEGFAMGHGKSEGDAPSPMGGGMSGKTMGADDADKEGTAPADGKAPALIMPPAAR